MTDKKKNVFRKKLEKLAELLEKINGVKYSLHDPNYHNWLIDQYDNRDEEIFGNWTFNAYIDYLIDRYESII